MSKTITNIQHYGVALVLLLAMLIGTPAEALAQKDAQQTVTLTMKKVSAKTFFTELKKQTGLNFVYSSELSESWPAVSITANKKTVKQILDEITLKLGCEYKIEGNVVTLYKQSLSGTKRNVSGIVRDEQGLPLIGVPVCIGETRVCTVTDDEGKFSFDIPVEKTTLKFSYVGMETQYVTIAAGNTSTKKNVKMIASNMLNDVVVTGYQVLDKRSLTSAVSSAKMEDLMRADVSSLDQMLEGRIPDLLVSNNSGEIGVAPKIRIRGTSTLVGNREPLWVVDGIVVSDPVDVSPEELNDPDYVNRIGNAIAGLNPQDIERIDVLKDAAATAIYGTKAANGVIVVTTKRGTEGKPQVNYTMNANFKLRPRYTDKGVDVMSSKERIQLSRELYQDHYSYPYDMTTVGYEELINKLYSGSITYDDFLSGVDAAEAQNTDWFKELTRDSWSTNHNISVSGGSKTSRYYASIGYTNDNDVIKVNNNERITYSMNLDNTFSRLFTASFSFKGYHYDRNYYQDGINPMDYAYTASRAIPAYNADGTYYNYERRIDKYDAYKYNVLNELDNSYKKQQTNSLSFTANMQFTFTDWLKANAIFSVTHQSTDMEGWWGEKTTHIAQERGSNYGESIKYPGSSTCPQGGELSKQAITDNNYTARIQLDANKYFGEDDIHNIDATLGMELNHDKYYSHSSVARGYFRDRGESFVTNIDPTIYTSYASWLASHTPAISDNLNNEFSTYMALTYAYKHRLRLNLNGRVDASNHFGDRSNEKFLPIWSISGSYDFMHLIEPLFGENKSFIDYLTLKASYGFQGNMLNTEYPVMTIKKESMNNYLGEFTSSIQNHPNPDLKWEKTRSFNLGLDMAFFDHRLAIEASYFYKKTVDAFMTKRISTVNGVGAYVINGGDVINKGYSFDITATPIRTKDFRWTLSTSISKIINTLDSKPDAQTYTLKQFLSGTALVEGQSVNTFYSYRYLGLSPVDGGPLIEDWYDNQEALRGLSQYDTYTTVLEASGKREADIQGSLTNSFRYKNWHASFTLGYSLGAKTRLFAMYSDAATTGVYGNTIYSEKNYSRDYINRWKKPGDELTTNLPAIMSSNSSAYYKYSRVWTNTGSNSDYCTIGNNYWEMYDYSNIRVVSADYLKLQSISITYDVPETLLHKWGLNRIALTASAYNLFTIADSALKGQTPIQGGFTSIQLSDRPSFSMGLNVIF